jgi:hypothetical protein
MQINNRSRRKIKVIVRSWGDEPVVLFLHRIDNTSVYVGAEDSNRAIGLPSSQVFSFDGAAFKALINAFAEGKKDKMASLYDDLAIKESICNRYQNMLDSLHDKENVTDLRSTANRGE